MVRKPQTAIVQGSIPALLWKRIAAFVIDLFIIDLTILMPFSGMALASWVALESVVVIAAQTRGQVIGPDMTVSGVIVVQFVALAGAVVLLVKFGMYLRDWKMAIDKALTMAASLTALEARMTQAEMRASDHDKAHAHLQMLINEQAERLGLADQRNTDRGRGRGA